MKILLAMIASAGLIGCVGDVSDMPEPGSIHDPAAPTPTNPSGQDLSAAKALFDANVYPIINGKCFGGACHSQAGSGGSVTKFVATNASEGWGIATNYQALVSNFTPSAAPILTMIKAGNHKGQTYAAAEEAKIVEWLNKEVELRNGQPSQPMNPGQETLSQATERVLSQFNGCMQASDFVAANMGTWGAMTAQNNTNCDNCHTNGGEGMTANRSNQYMYDVLSVRKYHFLQYFTVDLTMGAAGAKVVVNKASFVGVANGQDPHREHPRFNCPSITNCTNQGMTALTQLYNATMARVQMSATVCPTPKPLQNM